MKAGFSFHISNHLQKEKKGSSLQVELQGPSQKYFFLGKKREEVGVAAMLRNDCKTDFPRDRNIANCSECSESE